MSAPAKHDPPVDAPADDDDDDDPGFAQRFRDDRLNLRRDGLNAEIEDDDMLIDEAVEQTFPASDPPAVTRRPKKD